MRSRGCHALNQPQLLLRVGKADTVLELLIAQLGEQGLEICSRWEASDEVYIVDALCPQIHQWLENERWGRMDWLHRSH